MSLKFSAAIFLVLALSLLRDTAASQELTLSLKVSPESTQLVPGVAATLTLSVKAPVGQPPNAGWVALHLDAPVGGFFSTDFPVVEGSRLLELRLPIIDSKVEWRQVFPIRGEYRLGARLETAGSHAEQTFSFRVYEKKQKWLALGLLALGLFSLGGIAGRIFSTPDNAKRLLPGALLFLFLAYGGMFSEGVRAADSPTGKYTAKLDVAPAIVGKPARVHWSVHTSGVEASSAANLSFIITHLEKKIVVFALEKIPVAGEYAFDYQFTDGSDHRVSAIAVTPNGETVGQEQMVSVSVVAPPWSAQLPAFGLFMAVIFLGLVAGRWSRKG